MIIDTSTYKKLLNYKQGLESLLDNFSPRDNPGYSSAIKSLEETKTALDSYRNEFKKYKEDIVPGSCYKSVRKINELSVKFIKVIKINGDVVHTREFRVGIRGDLDHCGTDVFTQSDEPNFRREIGNFIGEISVGKLLEIEPELFNRIEEIGKTLRDIYRKEK